MDNEAAAAAAQVEGGRGEKDDVAEVAVQPPCEKEAGEVDCGGSEVIFVRTYW